MRGSAAIEPTKARETHRQTETNNVYGHETTQQEWMESSTSRRRWSYASRRSELKALEHISRLGRHRPERKANTFLHPERLR